MSSTADRPPPVHDVCSQAEARAERARDSLEIEAKARSEAEIAISAQRREIERADRTVERLEREAVEASHESAELHAALSALALEAKEARTEADQQSSAREEAGVRLERQSTVAFDSRAQTLTVAEASLTDFHSELAALCRHLLPPPRHQYDPRTGRRHGGLGSGVGGGSRAYGGAGGDMGFDTVSHAWGGMPQTNGGGELSVLSVNGDGSDGSGGVLESSAARCVALGRALWSLLEDLSNASLPG